MKRLVVGLLFMSIGAVVIAATADELLRLSQQQKDESARTQQAREARFSKAHAELKARHAVALREVRALEGRASSLRARINTDQQRVVELEQQLGTRGDDSLHVQRLLRVFARDLRSQLAESPIAVQASGRDKVFATLAEDNHNASARDLDALFALLRQELTESARVVKFQAAVRNNATDTRAGHDEMVTRVGAFTSVSDGRYLLHDARSGLFPASKQPGWRDRRVARSFENSTQPFALMRIDPTGGAWLKELVNRPDPIRPVLWAVALLAVVMALAAPLLRVLKQRLLPRSGVVGPWWGSYDRRFLTAVGVSELHLVCLILLLISIFGLSLDKATLVQQEVMEAISVSDAAPAQQISQSPGGGSPAPRPLPAIPTLAPTSLTPVVAAPSVNVDVVMPNLAMPVAPIGTAMLGKAFGGFAGGSGSGGGAGGGSGGGFGTGNMPGGGGKPLIPLSTARPQITDYAYRRGIEGWVVVVYTVGTNGRVGNIRIVDADPKGLFEGATVESISNWIYEPTDRPREVTQRIEFKLDDYQYNWK